jgi:hypothetical protein
LTEDEKRQLWEDNGLDIIHGEYIKNQDGNLMNAILKGQVYDYGKLSSIAEQFGIAASGLYSVAPYIENFQNYLEKETLVEGSKIAAYLGSSEIASTSKYGDQIAQGIAKQNLWEIDDKIEEKAEEYKKEEENDLRELYKQRTGQDSAGLSME